MRHPLAPTEPFCAARTQTQENLMNTRHIRRIQILAILVVMVAASATALYAQTYTVLYNFGSVRCDPLNPQVSGIIAQGRDGNLYSSTPGGGCDVNGVAFKITSKGKLSVVHSFQLNVGGDGIGPQSGLTLGTEADLNEAAMRRTRSRVTEPTVEMI